MGNNACLPTGTQTTARAWKQVGDEVWRCDPWNICGVSVRGVKLFELWKDKEPHAVARCGSFAEAKGTGDITHTLKAEGFDASEDGTGRGQPIICCHGTQDPCHDEHLAFAMGRNSGQENVVCLPFDTTQITSAANYSNPQIGDPCHPIAAGAHVPAIAFQSSQSGVRVSDTHATLDANNGPRRHNGAVVGMAVRRLTPVECERLQGFPDNYTRIQNWNGWRSMDASETPEQCAAEGLEVKQNTKTGKWRVKDVDGSRYKALGNSMAVPCMAFIGSRINAGVNAEKSLKKVAS